MCDVLVSILLGDENVKDQGGSLWEAGQFCETLLLQMVKPVLGFNLIPVAEVP